MSNTLKKTTEIIENIKLFWCKTNRWHRVVFLLALVEFKVLPARKAGFYCNDSSLSHPFTGDTISPKHLILITIFLPLVVLWLVECIISYERRNKLHDKELTKSWSREYLFGYLLNMTAVQLLKVMVGEPRPHFFDTCRPEESSSCEGSEYVSSFTCDPQHGTFLVDSNRSFPSGHSSLAVHAGFFVAWYLHRRVVKSSEKRSHVITAVQGVLVAAAILCALSRMWDHRHHWWDVLAGVLFGVGTMLYTVFFLCNNFEPNNSRFRDVPVEYVENSPKKELHHNTEISPNLDVSLPKTNSNGPAS